MAFPNRVSRRTAGRPVALLSAAAGIWFVLSASRGLCFAAPLGAAAPGGGPTRKQVKSTLHTRANLPPVLEVPLDEPEPEPAPKPEMPERRVPYTMHIISHFPNNKHLHEESSARKFIEEKIVNSLENMEDLIRHIEVSLQVSEGFHKEKPRHGKAKAIEGEDGVVEFQEKKLGTKFLAPYIFKVTVSLRNKRTIVFANAEKHAQPTLTEGVDHMVNVLRRSLREEKDKMLEARKREKQLADERLTASEVMAEAEAELEQEIEEIEAAKDKKADEFYKKMEQTAD